MLVGHGLVRTSRILAASLLATLLVGGAYGTRPAAAQTSPGDAAPQAQAGAAPATSWIRDEKHVIAPPVVHRYDYSLHPGVRKIVAAGAPGERDTIVRYTQGDDGSVARWVVASHVTRKPHPRIVVIGIDESQAFAQIEAHGIARMSQVAASAMHMVATAYTADCAGCGGTTASGRPAGRGVVAVDPRVIPLGTRLFISGYGPAVAGDTGGAIHGLRIDLGFNSLREAMLFGRREVTVYFLK